MDLRLDAEFRSIAGDIGLTSLTQSVTQNANISTGGRFSGVANIDYVMAASAITQSTPSLILTAAQGSIEIGLLRANQLDCKLTMISWMLNRMIRQMSSLPS